MRVIRTADFERALKRLPGRIRLLCEKQIGILIQDWRDSRLHLKKLREPYEGAFSFRVTRNYRGFFYFSMTNDVVIFDIDDRKDAYR
jgi:mRNA-degrading endonuclease RelE of RelBE toxin-antitoxin system